jgi:hypothetical protein
LPKSNVEQRDLHRTVDGADAQTERQNLQPRNPARLDIYVGELKQLFNAMDPAPFRKRDLDPNAERFIVD